MKLEADKENLTIMGVKFASMKDFKAVAYLLSTNMIEGWQPKVSDVRHLREKVEKTAARV